ncbi:hypothetical protein CBM2634_B160095 [Cupriavidus taiwanensis]|uniref:Uncharacterized protein n=1 Tax=Cupriavidus taiwanensis TaxID=164546 RepID=A0A375J5V8_9BURK|nr:hypothetical protein CBM2634_B160095 [Cupriavidus taiwanensis]
MRAFLRDRAGTHHDFHPMQAFVIYDEEESIQVQQCVEATVAHRYAITV